LTSTSAAEQYCQHFSIFSTNIFVLLLRYSGQKTDIQTDRVSQFIVYVNDILGWWALAGWWETRSWAATNSTLVCDGLWRVLALLGRRLQ